MHSLWVSDSVCVSLSLHLSFPCLNAVSDSKAGEGQKAKTASKGLVSIVIATEPRTR